MSAVVRPAPWGSPGCGCSAVALARYQSRGVVMQNPLLQCCCGRNFSGSPNTKWGCTYFSSGLLVNNKLKALYVASGYAQFHGVFFCDMHSSTFGRENRIQP